MKFKTCMSILVLLTLAFGCIAQKSMQINGSKAFTKSNIKLSADVAHITACSDTKLSKNCKSYFSTGGSDFQETVLTSTEANSIAKSKGLTGLKNVNTEKVNNKVSLSFIDKANARVYFIGHGKNLNIVEFSNPPRTIAKRPSIPENIDCRNACIDAKGKCFYECTVGSTGGATTSSYYDCLDGCAISFLGCTGICDKYVKKIQIVLNNILVKPISFQK